MTDTSELEVGDRVTNADTPPEQQEMAIVVETPETTAEESYIGELGKTVADVNPKYPPDDPVATVAFVDDLDTWASGWRMVRREELADELAVLNNISLYTYPESRLELVDHHG